MKCHLVEVSSDNLFLTIFLIFWCCKYIFRLYRKVWTILYLARSGFDCDGLISVIAGDFRTNSGGTKLINSHFS